MSISSSATMPCAGEPARPLLAGGLAHEHRPRVRRGRLGARGRDAVVPDHRCREADELLRIARVGDDLLVARHRGREDRLPEGDIVGADRPAVEDRPVFEDEEAAHARVRQLSVGDGLDDLALEGLAEEPGVGRARPEAALFDAPRPLEVEDDEVRRGADRDPRPLQPVDAGRPGTHAVDQRGERERPRLDQARVEHREGRLEAGDAEGRLLERNVLLVTCVRRVVGGDRLDRPVLQRLEERLPVFLRREAAGSSSRWGRVSAPPRRSGRGGEGSPRRSPARRPSERFSAHRRIRARTDGGHGSAGSRRRRA